VATWGTAQQLYRANVTGRGATAPAPPAPAAPAPRPAGPARRFGIPPALASVNNQTIRMIARISVPGRRVRVRLQNALGSSTVNFDAAHIALRGKDSGVVAGSDRALTFSGKPAATLYAGGTLVSDPVDLALSALAEVAVSLYVTGEAGAPTNHLFALHTTYLSKPGDFTGAPEIAEPTTRESYYWLAGIDVLAPAEAGVLVTFGDSITDGDQSTHETNGAWPSLLAARLHANKATAHVSVVNAGISGNRVLGNNGSGLVRFYHDALVQPGVKWISILEGINDITGGSRGLPNTPKITSEMLITAYRQMIEMAHLHGVKVIGCTITPYGGSNVYNDYGESVRSEVNEWIRHGGAFDGVIDFDAATRDKNDPKRFRAEADSPDNLHPANPGYKLMADAVNLNLFKK
ncbi:MAG: SGNH/GDSL hydrolase family protein, partial [Acidobacteriota bacterium]